MLAAICYFLDVRSLTAYFEKDASNFLFLTMRLHVGGKFVGSNDLRAAVSSIAPGTTSDHGSRSENDEGSCSGERVPTQGPRHGQRQHLLTNPNF
ncbi:hypothetical protein Y032_0174g479 [Ancylostoma ceylanicum]|uniref:Uncharacterized protein n=1 Tax=Ancylostoma ceylanicum TaxID=53326 RepID=A0A016SV33_9BILA|nr:hypothetical protein Y032_0174g479 [Ancylostoma ceylanicum]